MHIRGVFPPIATPFGANGDLDGDALQANIGRWNETGLSGYVVAGSNGESVMLDFDEVLAATRLVRAAALPEHLVITGTGQQSAGPEPQTQAAA
jgi:4-hydroxy-2-oxoglutarate aldolase